MYGSVTSALVLLASATLFFLELHVGQALAPVLGGGAPVWLTTVLGFQVILLLGYASAAFGFDPRVHARVSAGLLVIGAGLWDRGPTPVPGLGIGVILCALGLATVLPLTLRGHGDATAAVRGRWIALSNGGALVGLIAYAVAEPWMGLSRGADVLVVAVAVIALVLLRSGAGPAPRGSYRPHAFAVAGAAVGVYWYMSLHARIEATAPPSPQLWAMTLGLYLISFALPFLRGTVPATTRWAAVALAIGAALFAETVGYRAIAGFIGLFVGSLSAHAALRQDFDADRPWTHGAVDAALGGATAGAIALVVSPLVFTTHEQTVLAAAGLVVLEIARVHRGRVVAAAGAATAILAIGFGVAQPLQPPDTLRTVRTWYGESRVIEYEADSPLHHHLALKHQNTIHGAQYLADDLLDLPVAYFSIYSGAGLALNALDDARGYEAPLRVAAVGLGTGAIATYSDENDFMRFVEIDARMAALATGDEALFRYLEQSRGEVEVEIDDGRRWLAADDEVYDAIVLDAFSGGHVPTHLLTVEAFELYRERVAPNGWIAIHTSNANLDLRPVVYAAAARVGARAVFVRNHRREARDASDRANHVVMLADWIVIGWDDAPWPELRARMQPFLAGDQIVVQWADTVRFDGIDAWTDDHRSVWTVRQTVVGERERLID